MGEDASQALANYFTEDVINGIPTFEADLDENPSLKSYLRIHAGTEINHFNQVTALVAENTAAQEQIAERDNRYNDLIVQEFEQCTAEAIDLGSDNPFGGIIQRITNAYAQTADEVSIAQERVSTVIAEECGEYLQHVSSDLREELVAGLAAKLEEPIQTAVTSEIERAQNVRELFFRFQGAPSEPTRSYDNLDPR